MKYRSAAELRAEHLGRRVTVRRKLPDGRSGDVIGLLRSIDEDEIVVMDRGGADVTIRRADVVAARVVEHRE
jgi:hypothetical protein